MLLTAVLQILKSMLILTYGYIPIPNHSSD